MLKIKEKLHYRRGYTHGSCKDCNYYIGACELVGIGGKAMAPQPRCEKIGLEPGRMYYVSPNNICDEFDNSRLLRRIRGY